MKNMIRLFMEITLLVMLSLTLTSCGSVSQSPPKSKAKASLKTVGLVQNGLFVETIDLTISFPNGITAALPPGKTYDSPSTHDQIKNILQYINNNVSVDRPELFTTLDYTPASPAANGSLRIVAMSADGFTPSDSLLIQLDITAGTFPKESDFSLLKFEVTPVKIVIAGGNPVFTNYSAKPVTNPVFKVTSI